MREVCWGSSGKSFLSGERDGGGESPFPTPAFLSSAGFCPVRNGSYFSLLKTLTRRPHGPQRGWTSAQRPLSCWVSQSWAKIQASCHVRCFHTFITQGLAYWLVLLSVTCSSKHAHRYKWYKDHTLISPATCVCAHTHITFFLLTLYSILLEPKTLLPLLTEWETGSETDVFYHMELWGHMLWVAEPLSVAWQIENNLTCAYLQAMTLFSQETLVLHRSLRSCDG